MPGPFSLSRMLCALYFYCFILTHPTGLGSNLNSSENLSLMPQVLIFWFLNRIKSLSSHTCSQVITFCFKKKLTHYASRSKELYLICSLLLTWCFEYTVPSTTGAQWVCWGNKCLTSTPLYLHTVLLPLTFTDLSGNLFFDASGIINET